MVVSVAMVSTSDIRRQFPLLEQKGLIYLDSAATAQKPQVVLDAMKTFYEKQNGNAHRGMHPLAEAATEALENARERVRSFINAKSTEEIIFTKSCTEAINLVAHAFGKTCHPGDAIVTTVLEHHSNIVPWQQLQETGVSVRWVPCDAEGTLDLDVLAQHVADGKVRLVAMTAQSNVLGVRPDVKKMIEMAHNAGALTLVDAAQSIAHEKTDVQELDCDFLAFSGHKLYGPMGIGVLYGKKKLLTDMPPFLGGGMMIREVTQNGFSTADLPQKFEAGTQPIAEVAGLHAALDWISQFSWNEIQDHEQALIAHAHAELSKIDGLKILGPSDAKKMHGCISFVIDGVHPHDLTDVLGQKGICLRAGHHCAQPLHKQLDIGASTRLSVGIYNTIEELNEAAQQITAALELLKV